MSDEAENDREQWGLGEAPTKKKSSKQKVLKKKKKAPSNVHHLLSVVACRISADSFFSVVRKVVSTLLHQDAEPISKKAKLEGTKNLQEEDAEEVAENTYNKVIARRLLASLANC